MPASPFARRRAYLVFGAAALLIVIIGFAGRLVTTRTQSHILPVAAFLLPVDEESRVATGWWRTRVLTAPLTLHSGDRVRIPEGSKVRVLRASDGKVEIMTGPAKLQLQQKSTDTAHPLVTPFRELVPSLKPLFEQNRNVFCITSPVSVTRYLNPAITWTARESIVYDVAVADQADPNAPVRLARNVKPPVLLSELVTSQRRLLSADRNYEVAVRVAGAPAAAASARFLTHPDATADATLAENPADLIADAAAALAVRPSRTGDAWLALAKLPSEWSRSELGVRLRLRVAAELGRAELFEAATADSHQLIGD